MKTIGSLLREKRLQKNLTYAELEEETKIKKLFIRAIEEEKWNILPDFAVVSGFVKNIASSIDLDPKEAVAFLRRDYPPQKKSISPSPTIEEEKIHWGPRISFLIGAFILISLVAGYLFVQYREFTSPPPLVITSPKEEEVIAHTKVIVSGKTDPEVAVTVNNQPAYIEENGNFKTEIEVTKETKQIEIKALSRSGKETTITRKIVIR